MANDQSDNERKAADRGSAGASGPLTIRRFKQSGNRKGRPKGAKNRKTIVREIANEMHIVHENGARRRRSTLELVFLRLRNLAVEGKKTRAFDEFQKLIKKYEPQMVNNQAGFLVVPAPVTMEEFIEMQKANPPIHPKERRRLKAEK